MTTKGTEKLSLEIKRLIKAPRDRVYAAWTDPAQLKQWFGPEKVQTRDLVADAHVGGKFRWDLINSEGEEMTCRGKYRELDPGKEGVRGKIDWWVNKMQVHSFKASEPFVAHDRFVVQYDVDVTDKGSKKRMQMSEVGVYTVKNGKIVREEFLPLAG